MVTARSIRRRARQFVSATAVLLGFAAFLSVGSTEALATTPSLLVGDATTTYPVADQTAAGREESFQFTAKFTGKVEELEFRTNGTANTGVTGVVLGVFAESGGKPGGVLGQIKVSGEPATNSWIKATGLSISVVSGTKYWLVVLPLGESSKRLHYNAAVSSGGTGNVESIATGLSTLTAESSWEAYNQGPVGFQAIGIPAPTNIEPPTISGTAQQGQTLTEAHGSWTNEPTSYAYQWLRCNASGAECSSISAATNQTYVLVAGDVGHKITVQETASNAGGSSSPASSSATAVVVGLLVGDATTTYSVADQTTAGREETFQFTAKSTGKVEELEFRTNATANTGITGITLGVFAENAGKPGELLGQAKVSGEPATNSWIKATGLSISVVSGTKYWLAVLPLGSNQLHFNAAVSSGGTGNVESIATGLSTLTAESSWETYNQGSVGFQAIGSTLVVKPYVGFSNAPADVNFGKKAEEVGAQVIRGSTEYYTMKEYAEICVNDHLKLSWLIGHTEGPTEGNVKKTIEEYGALTAAQKEVFVLFEVTNEPYESEGTEHFVNGKAYGKDFISISEEWTAKGETVPLGMYARVSKQTGTGSGSEPEKEKWMTELGENKRTGTKSLESALIGSTAQTNPQNGEKYSKTNPQNKLISHNYGGSPAEPLKNINSLSTTEPKEAAEAAGGDESANGAERWIHEQAIVSNWTGVTGLQTAITETGASTTCCGGTEKIKNEYIKEDFEVAHKAWKGELSADAPSGYGSPQLYETLWYDEQNNSEGYGIIEENSPFAGLEPYYATFKAQMATFAE